VARKCHLRPPARAELVQLERAVDSLNLWSELHVDGHAETNAAIAALAAALLRLKARLDQLERRSRRVAA
jgi:hypothetical protein